MTTHTLSPYPICTHVSSGEQVTPCVCCAKWLAWIESREIERSSNHTGSLGVGNGNNHWNEQHHGNQLNGMELPCQFTGLNESTLDIDCCPLENFDGTNTENVNHHGQHTNCMHDGSGHHNDHSQATSSAITCSQGNLDSPNCVWPTQLTGGGSPFLNGSTAIASLCPTTPALSLCVSSSCVPTINLSQQFLAAATASGMTDDSAVASFSNPAVPPPLQVNVQSHPPLACPEEQMHFHHHHHSSLPTMTTPHVHCNEEEALSHADAQLRSAHRHTTACNPQVHYQFQSDNVIHDHTVPLLEISPQPNNSATGVKSEPTVRNNYPTSQQRAPVTTSAPSSTYLPCSRVHTFQQPFRFHPYGGAAAGNHSPASRVGINNGNGNGSSVGEGTSTPTNGGGNNPTNAPASNCHQCKVKKFTATVIQCTAVHEVTVRRSKPMCCVQKKKCAKKYCATCLAKHYGLTLDQLDRSTFVCPGCMGLCTCAACMNKRNVDPNMVGGGGGGADQIGTNASDPQAANEMQTTHTHHQHLHTHTHTTTYGYGHGGGHGMNQSTSGGGGGGGGGQLSNLTNSLDERLNQKLTLRDPSDQSMT